jgi:hypothetical protein
MSRAYLWGGVTVVITDDGLYRLELGPWCWSDPNPFPRIHLFGRKR